MFLDTSGLFCYFDTKQASHADAVRLLTAADSRLTHSYVLAELVALCEARGLNRTSSLEYVQEIAEDSAIEVVWIGEHEHREALSLVFQRLDKKYSLCDAISFLLMRERGETEALTTDHHFEQEGFIRLLEP